MRSVVLVASSFLPRFGGVEEHVLSVARQLRARGDTVAIWTVDQGDDPVADVEGIPVRYLPAPLPARAVGNLARFAASAPSAWRQWNRALQADRPDVINIQCFGPNGVYATALARRHRIPLVYSNHGETFMDADDSFGRSALMRRSLRVTLSQAAAVTACSRFAGADLARFGADPAAVDVVYNGVDATIVPDLEGLSLPGRFFAGVGRLVENKGFDDLLRAFAAVQVHGGGLGVELVIAGEGPARAELEALAARLGVAARTRFIGRLSRAQVAAVMQRAIALVVPSRVEAFGITVLEGWRAGIPVIATSHGGVGEFLTDGIDGYLVDPSDTGALAARLSVTLDDPVTTARVAVAGRARLLAHDWGGVALRYQGVYDRAVG